MKKEIAAFGAGCFWGVQSVFDRVKGVLKTEVGYMGGDEGYENVSYEMVCSGKTWHAETVKVEFNPSKISYSELLDVFWKSHDPTQLNRQGFDFGTQYRSVIFYYNDKQKKEAEMSLLKKQKELGKKKIVTEIVKARKFYRAEEYHQKYNEKHGKVC